MEKKQKFTEITITQTAILKRVAGRIQHEVYLQFEYDKAPEKGYRIEFGKNVMYARGSHISGTESSRILYVSPKYANAVAKGLQYSGYKSNNSAKITL